MSCNEHEVRIPMVDGVQLAASLYLPDDVNGPQPCLMEALPYRKDDLTSSYAESYRGLCDEHGYAVCRLDLRGTGSSAGDATDEYPEIEQTDLVAVVAWLADQQAMGHVGSAKGLHRAERVVPVTVRPARHQHHRTPDAAVVGPYRAVPPVVPVDLLVEPGQQPGLACLNPAQPLGSPILPPKIRNRRQRIHRGHVVAVVEQVEKTQRAAPVVHVIGVAVVGRIDRDDRLEPGRPLARHLQGVEARVRRAEHADLAVAPLLRREPADRVRQVGLLGRLVLVEGVAGRRTGAAHIDPAHGVPVLLAQ